MVNSKINGFSSNEQVFSEATPTYLAALDKNGHKHKLRFERPNQKNRQRDREITWYNPPFNLVCTVNLGKEFLKLIDKHFPQKTKRKDNQEQIINRQSIKLSYSVT